MYPAEQLVLLSESPRSPPIPSIRSEWIEEASSLLLLHPDLFEDVFVYHDFDNGMFCIGLYSCGKRLEIVVDDFIPLFLGIPLFANSTVNREWGWTILEK